MLARLFALVRTLQELTETSVAVGDERPHSELLGERERVPVVALSVLQRSAPGGGLAEEPQGQRLAAALTALAGKGQGSPGEVERVLEPVGEDVRFAQIHQVERLINRESH